MPKNVYSFCCGSTLDPKYEDIITCFKNSWQAIIDEPIVKLSWTPKAHHIADHFVDYFKDPLVNNQALGRTSDQIIEHMHSYIDRMLNKSKYKLKIADSDRAAKKQHAGILKINSFAVRISNIKED